MSGRFSCTSPIDPKDPKVMPSISVIGVQVMPLQIQQKVVKVETHPRLLLYVFSSNAPLRTSLLQSKMSLQGPLWPCIAGCNYKCKDLIVIWGRKGAMLSDV